MTPIPDDIVRKADDLVASLNTTASREDQLVITARAIMDERARCARLARITHPHNADFSGIWGEYEHGCDDTQGAIHAAILKGET